MAQRLESLLKGLLDGADDSENGGMGDPIKMGQGFLGDVLSVAEEGDFRGLGQGELIRFFCWLGPGEVGLEGC